MLNAVSTLVPGVAAASAYEQSEPWEPRVRMVGKHNVEEELGVAGTAL